MTDLLNKILRLSKNKTMYNMYINNDKEITYNKDSLTIGKTISGKIFRLDLSEGIRLSFLGTVGCLIENTEILSKNNKKIKLNKKVENKLIDTLSYKNNKIINSKSLVINSGVKEVYEIKLDNNKKIIASEDHIFFLKNNLKEKTLKDLKIGDELFEMY